MRYISPLWMFWNEVRRRGPNGCKHKEPRRFLTKDGRIFEHCLTPRVKNKRGVSVSNKEIKVMLSGQEEAEESPNGGSTRCHKAKPSEEPGEASGESFGAIASYSQLCVNELQLRLNGQSPAYELGREYLSGVGIRGFGYLWPVAHLIYATIDRPVAGKLERSCRTVAFATHAITEVKQ